RQKLLAFAPATGKGEFIIVSCAIFTNHCLSKQKNIITSPLQSRLLYNSTCILMNGAKLVKKEHFLSRFCRLIHHFHPVKSTSSLSRISSTIITIHNFIYLPIFFMLHYKKA